VAEFNQLLASSFADFIRRRFGEDVLLSAIAPELIPVIALQMDRPEWSWLLGESPLALALQQPLNAAQNSAFQIRNPPGSNVLVMVDEAEVAPGASAEVALCVQQVSAADMTTLAGTNVGRDTRLGGNRGIAVVSSQNNVAVTNLIRRALLLAQTTWVWRNLGVALAPGSSLQVVTFTNNINLDGSFSWRERRVRPEELQ